MLIKWSQPMLLFNITLFEESLRTLVVTRDIETGQKVIVPGIEIQNSVDRYSMSKEQYEQHSFNWKLKEWTEDEWLFILTFN